MGVVENEEWYAADKLLHKIRGNTEPFPSYEEWLYIKLVEKLEPGNTNMEESNEQA